MKPVAVVTGAASGIGREIAQQLAADGCRVLLVDRDAAGLAALAATLPDAGSVAVDLQRHEAWEQVLAALGPDPVVDWVVHAAGLTVHGPFADHGAADIDRVLGVDLVAPVQGTRALLPALRRSARGRLVLISSSSALFPVPMQSTYAAAKTGLRAFGAALRIELSTTHVTLTVVLPGTVATPFLRHGGSHHPTTSAWMAEQMLRFGMSPAFVATRTLAAARAGRAEVVLGWDAHLTRLVMALCPPLLPALLRWGWRRLTQPHP